MQVTQICKEKDVPSSPLQRLTIVKWRPTFLTKMKFAGIWDWLALLGESEPSSLSLESNWAPISSLRLERLSSGRTLQYFQPVTQLWCSAHGIYYMVRHAGLVPTHYILFKVILIGIRIGGRNKSQMVIWYFARVIIIIIFIIAMPHLWDGHSYEIILIA